LTVVAAVVAARLLNTTFDVAPDTGVETVIVAAVDNRAVTVMALGFTETSSAEHLAVPILVPAMAPAGVSKNDD